MVPFLDLHVHLLAMFPEETDGGWFPLKNRGRPVFRFLRYGGGLPRRDAGFDFDFRARLAARMEEAESLATGRHYSGFRAVALALDRAYDTKGRPLDSDTDFYVSNAYALRLAGRRASQEQFRVPGLLAGVSIHPYRRDALNALRQSVSQGAALVKWLPTSQNIDPASPQAVDFARECQALHIPLLVHTGPEGATRDCNPAWNNPRALEPLLSTGTVVIAAHSGMGAIRRSFCHFNEWIAMLPDWPNLYGDTAALFGDRPRTLVRALGRPLVVERLLHGSDWPVPVWPIWHWPGLPLKTILRLSRIRNPFWRDIETKLEAGLPESSFTKGWSLFPENLIRPSE
jgi:hypothetical protein